MKKTLAIIITFVLALTTLGASASAAGKPDGKGKKQPLVLKEKAWSVVEVYDADGKVISETIVPEEGTNLEEISSEVMEAEDVEVTEIGTEAYVDPGSMNYYYLDTWYGTSEFLDELKDWAVRFAAAAIPYGLGASAWSSMAASSAFSAFHDAPPTRYYKNVIYQAKDTYYYYGKVTDYEYSDSGRTNLTRKHTYYRQTPRQ